MEITVTEAADRLKVTPGRVRHFIEEGRLQATKKGPIYLIDAKAVAAFKRRKRPSGKHLKNGKKGY